MKKLLLIGALICASAGILASVSYRTSCGPVFTSTGTDGYPGGEAEYNDWLMDMNEYYCGVRILPFEINPDNEPPLIP